MTTRTLLFDFRRTFASLIPVVIACIGTPSVAQTSQVVNISTRAEVLQGNNVMIAGFIIQGAPQTVVVTATGPSLAAAGVTGALGDPALTLVRSADQAVIATNDDWATAANSAAISGLGLAPSDPHESAIMMTLAPGAYTAIVSGSNGTVGVGLVAVYAVPNINQVNTSRLLGGTWTFVYTIISTFSDTYRLLGTTPTPDGQGHYFAIGANETNTVVDAAYFADTDTWSLLDQTVLFDRFFVFSFATNNSIAGCYFQVTPPGSTNLGPCFPLNGSRFPALSLASGIESKSVSGITVRPSLGQLQAEAAEYSGSRQTEQWVIDAYLAQRSATRSLSNTVPE